MTVMDLNGDNISDIVIGAPYAYNNSGNVYVFFGEKNRDKLAFNLSYLDEQNGFIINAVGQELKFGQKISHIGDINK